MSKNIYVEALRGIANWLDDAQRIDYQQYEGRVHVTYEVGNREESRENNNCWIEISNMAACAFADQLRAIAKEMEE